MGGAGENGVQVAGRAEQVKGSVCFETAQRGSAGDAFGGCSFVVAGL